MAEGRSVENEEAIKAEIERYDQAVVTSLGDVTLLKSSPALTHRDEALAILEMQEELIQDPQLRSDTIDMISAEHISAHDALIKAAAVIARQFREMNDDYMSARAIDIEDIAERIVGHLGGRSSAPVQVARPDTIIVADDITPSEMLTIDFTNVIGFATRDGARTSHTAIIARSKGIPAVTGCGTKLNEIKDLDLLIIDGINGQVIIHPEEHNMQDFKEMQEKHIRQQTLLRSLKAVPAITKDGQSIRLFGNIASAGDMDQVLENGGEGVGLFRTEMLFMARNSFPSEEEQFEFYRQVAIRSRNTQVVIRTMDIGGDKQLPYFNLPHEENPFMGYRAIRISLDRKEVFITQLKAILRAAVFGKFRVMFPMISSVQELRLAKEILATAKMELLRDHCIFEPDIMIGIMIEIPSAALIADILAKEVDFFSIGTNDLCQYTLAVDRMNGKVSGLYDHFNPGVLRLIKYVIEQAKKNNIDVGMCGEMAGDPLATLLLAGMGLDTFSMNAASIPVIKDIIIRNGIDKAKDVCKKVMDMDNSKNIIRYLEGLHN